MTDEPPDLMADLLDTKDAAKTLRVSSETMKKWRQSSKGPPPCQVGGRVYYRIADLKNWVEKESTRKYPAFP